MFFQFNWYIWRTQIANCGGIYRRKICVCEVPIVVETGEFVGLNDGHRFDNLSQKKKIRKKYSVRGEVRIGSDHLTCSFFSSTMDLQILQVYTLLSDRIWCPNCVSNPYYDFSLAATWQYSRTLSPPDLCYVLLSSHDTR